MIEFKEAIRSERVRGFQPPWRTVLVYRCKECRREIRLRKDWLGPTPRGGFLCDCEIEEREKKENT